jgi:hypothetical protein
MNRKLSLLASFLARLLEYPTDHLDLAGDGWPFARLLRPLVVGLLALIVVAASDRFVFTPATKPRNGAVVRTPALRSARVTREKRGRSEAIPGADQEREGNRKYLYPRSNSDLARSR